MAVIFKQIIDKTGNFKAMVGNAFVQTTAANQAAINANGVNGLPCLTFDGTNDFCTAALGVDYTTFTLSALFRLGDTNRNPLISFNNHAVIIDLYDTTSANKITYWDATNGTVNLSDSALSLNMFYYLEIVKTALNIKVYLNSALIKEVNLGTANPSLAGTMNLCFDGTNYGKMCIQELKFQDVAVLSTQVLARNKKVRSHIYVSIGANYYTFFPYSNTQMKQHNKSLYITGTCASFLGNRYYFDGSNFMQVANSSDVQFDTELTVMVRAKIGTPRADHNVLIANNGAPAQARDGFCLSYYQPGNAWLLYTQNSGVSAFTGTGNLEGLFIIRIKKDEFKSVTLMKPGGLFTDSYVALSSNAYKLQNDTNKFCTGGLGNGTNSMAFIGEIYPPIAINKILSITEALSLYKSVFSYKRI